MENLLFLRRCGLPASRQPACGHERLHLRREVPWTLHLWAWTHCPLLAGAHWPPCTGYASGQKGGSVGFQLKANFGKNSRLTTQESRPSPYVETECHTAQSHNMSHASSEQGHAFTSAKWIGRWGSGHRKEKPGELSGRAGSSATQSSLDCIEHFMPWWQGMALQGMEEGHSTSQSQLHSLGLAAEVCTASTVNTPPSWMTQMSELIYPNQVHRETTLQKLTHSFSYLILLGCLCTVQYCPGVLILGYNRHQIPRPNTICIEIYALKITS